MARPKSLERQIEDLAKRFTPRIRTAFLSAIQGVTNSIVLNEVIEAVRLGDVERAFRVTGLSPAAMRPITAMIEQAFETGGVTTVETFPRLTDPRGGSSVFRFDVRNSRAEAWLRDHSSRLVTRITEDTRTAIRNIMQDGVQAGRNPRSIALDIAGRVGANGRRMGGIIGLTVQQERYVTNARRELMTLDPHYFTREKRDLRFDGMVRKAIASETPLSQTKIDAIIGKYSDNLLLLRGETIARTEALQSLNVSSDEAFRQAVDSGSIPPEAITRTWDSAGDSRVRDTHASMNGQTVNAMNEPFTSPNGARLLFPGDTSLGAPASEIINCRCRVRHKVDWLAGIN